MKTTITLELKTREAYQLFTRKIKGDRLFIDAILRKLNKIAGQCKKGVSGAEVCYQTIQQNLTGLAKQFETDTTKYLELIQQNPSLKNKEITVKSQFSPQIRVENQLAITLVKLLEKYDHLISTIKLLHLVGCFESVAVYYSNIKHTQKLINQTLGKIIAKPSLHSTSITT